MAQSEDHARSCLIGSPRKRGCHALVVIVRKDLTGARRAPYSHKREYGESTRGTAGRSASPCVQLSKETRSGQTTERESNSQGAPTQAGGGLSALRSARTLHRIDPAKGHRQRDGRDQDGRAAFERGIGQRLNVHLALGQAPTCATAASYAPGSSQRLSHLVRGCYCGRIVRQRTLNMHFRKDAQSWPRMLERPRKVRQQTPNRRQRHTPLGGHLAGSEPLMAGLPRDRDYHLVFGE